MRRNQSLKLSLKKHLVLNELANSVVEFYKEIEEDKRWLAQYEKEKEEWAKAFLPHLRKLKASDIVAGWCEHQGQGNKRQAKITFKYSAKDFPDFESRYEVIERERNIEKLKRQIEELNRLIRLVKMSEDEIVPASLCKDILDYIR